MTGLLVILVGRRFLQFKMCSDNDHLIMDIEILLIYVIFILWF
jgi:hypothetical protein